MKTVGLAIQNKKPKSETFWVNISDLLKKCLRDEYYEEDFEVVIIQRVSFEVK